MEGLIRISNINDYVFCPHSIYLHGIYESFHENVYKDNPQKAGTFAHLTIDAQKYSSSSQYLQAIPVYSASHGIMGKIDVYDKKKHSLIERKRLIKIIYPGYRYQLYAQYYCLLEMGYQVNALYLHSLSNNKRYSVPLPEGEEKDLFFATLEGLRNYQAGRTKFKVNKKKCQMCIYRQLCTCSKC